MSWNTSNASVQYSGHAVFSTLDRTRRILWASRPDSALSISRRQHLILVSRQWRGWFPAGNSPARLMSDSVPAKRFRLFRLRARARCQCAHIFWREASRLVDGDGGPHLQLTSAPAFFFAERAWACARPRPPPSEARSAGRVWSGRGSIARSPDGNERAKTGFTPDRLTLQTPGREPGA